MGTYTIFSDYHLGHPLGLKPDFKFNKNTVFLGDNFDIKNSLKKELTGIRKMREETIKNVQKNKGIYLSGNHSLEPLSNKSKLFAIRDNILFIHGDLIEWSRLRSYLYRSMSRPGKNKYHWHFLKKFRTLFPGNVSIIKNSQIKKAVKLAKNNNCHTIVMGHFHPKRKIDINVDNIRIVILKQGKSLIKL